jgi:hypothetical protein
VTTVNAHLQVLVCAWGFPILCDGTPASVHPLPWPTVGLAYGSVSSIEKVDLAGERLDYLQVPGQSYGQNRDTFPNILSGLIAILRRDDKARTASTRANSLTAAKMPDL